MDAEVNAVTGEYAWARVHAARENSIRIQVPAIHCSVKKTVSCEMNISFIGIPREMENISRGPTFGDFVTIRTEASMQYVTVARLQSTKSIDSPLPPLLNVMYCMRVSLWDRDTQHFKILWIRESLTNFSFVLQDNIQKLKDRLEQPKAKLMALHEKLAELKLNKTEIEVMYSTYR
jgi:hypothetical protein